MITREDFVLHEDFKIGPVQYYKLGIVKSYNMSEAACIRDRLIQGDKLIILLENKMKEREQELKKYPEANEQIWYPRDIIGEYYNMLEESNGKSTR